MKSLKVFLALGLMLGCTTTTGSEQDAGPVDSGPSTRVISNDQAVTLAAGGHTHLPFTVGAAAQVDYTITNRSSGSPDTFRVFVAAPNEYAFYTNGQTFNAYGARTGTATESGTTTVPAGTYEFVVECTNSIQNCQFSVTVSTTW